MTFTLPKNLRLETLETKLCTSQMWNAYQFARCCVRDKRTTDLRTFRSGCNLHTANSKLYANFYRSLTWNMETNFVFTQTKYEYTSQPVPVNSTVINLRLNSKRVQIMCAVIYSILLNGNMVNRPSMAKRSRNTRLHTWQPTRKSTCQGEELQTCTQAMHQYRDKELSVAELFCADRQTDRQTDMMTLIVDFRNFAWAL